MDDVKRLASLIGKRIQTLRQRKGLTLSELAKIAGISKSTLSEIESGKVNSTITTLWSIAKALGITFGELIQPLQEVCEEDVCVQLLKDGYNVEIYLMKIRKGVTYISKPHPEGTREHIIVLEGEMICGPLNNAKIVKQGQLISFYADRTHIYATLSKDSKCIVVVEYPETFATPNIVLNLDSELSEEEIVKNIEKSIRRSKSVHILLKNSTDNIYRILDIIRSKTISKIVNIQRDCNVESIFIFNRNYIGDIKWIEKLSNCNIDILNKYVHTIHNIFKSRNISNILKSIEYENWIFKLLISEYLTFLNKPNVNYYISNIHNNILNIMKCLKQRYEILYSILEIIRPGYVRPYLLILPYILNILEKGREVRILHIDNSIYSSKLILSLIPEKYVNKISIVHVCLDRDLITLLEGMYKDFNNTIQLCYNIDIKDRYDLVVCRYDACNVDLNNLLNAVNDKLSSNCSFIVYGNFISNNLDEHSVIKSIVINYLTYIVDSLVDLDTNDLSSIERKIIMLVKICSVDSLHYILSGRFYRGLTYFLKCCKEIVDLLNKYDLNFRDVNFIHYIYSMLEILLLRSRISNIEYQYFSINDIVYRFGVYGFRVYESFKVYETYVDNGMYVIVFRYL